MTARGAIEAAIRQIHDEDASYRGLAQDLQCSLRAFSTVYNDTDHRQWYLDCMADDDRVQRALDELVGMEETA